MYQILFGEWHFERGTTAMKSESEIRQTLRDWIIKTSGKIEPDDLADQTPIIERRIISSLQVLDFILFIEKTSGNQIDVESLRPGVFRDIDTIYKNFFQSSGA